MKFVASLQPFARFLGLVLIGASCALFPTIVHAATIQVDTTDYGVKGDNRCSLVEAIIAANTNKADNGCPAGDDNSLDTIILAEDATYALTGVYGNYVGPTGLPSITSQIFIRGNGARIERSSSDSFGLFHVAAGQGNLTLEEITLRSGVAVHGGAIANEGVLMLVDSTVIANTASVNGGAIYNTNATATLVGTTIADGQAKYGGGIYTVNSTLTLTDTTFFNNQVLHGYGGAIHNDRGTAWVSNSFIISNSAPGGGNGGGISNVDATMIVTATDILSNTDVLFGGGFYNAASTVTVVNSRIAGNQVGKDGGGMMNVTSMVTVNGSLLLANGARESGGGVFTDGGTTFVVDSTFEKNVAREGGGMFNFQQGRAIVTDTLFYNNEGVATAGAINNYNGGSAHVTRSDIIGNKASTGGGVFNHSSGDVTFIDCYIALNSAEVRGGGLATASSLLPVTTLINTEVVSNTAKLGGGIQIGFSSSTALYDSTVSGNIASDSGGGIYMDGQSTLTAENVTITANQAVNGGGLYNLLGRANFSDSHISGNIATENGGGLANRGGVYDNENAITILVDSEVSANQAAEGGGGVYSRNSRVFLTRTLIAENTAGLSGGGILAGGHTTLFASQIVSNTTLQSGAGIYMSYGVMTSTQTIFVGNSAGVNGGGMYVNNVELEIEQTQWRRNTAKSSGAALYHVMGSYLLGTNEITQSCFEQNGDVAFADGGNVRIDAADNWWGAADGPSGAAPGSGDSISADVNYTPYLASPPASCSLTFGMLGFSLTANANTAHAKVGDTVTYTYWLTNTGTLTLTTVEALDDLLGALSELEHALAPGESATTTRSHVVTDVDRPGPLVNEITVSASDGTDDINDNATRTRSVSVMVVLDWARNAFLPRVAR